MAVIPSLYGKCDCRKGNKLLGRFGSNVSQMNASDPRYHINLVASHEINVLYFPYNVRDTSNIRTGPDPFPPPISRNKHVRSPSLRLQPIPHVKLKHQTSILVSHVQSYFASYE